jgi:hypothetical protein
MREDLINSLEQHLNRIEMIGVSLYAMKLKSMILKLRKDGYEYEGDLIRDLTALGFPDLAKKIKSGMY